MDLYLFILYLIIIVGSLTLSGGFLFYFGIRPQTKQLIAHSKALQLKLNQLKAEMGNAEPEDFVGSAIAQGGIEGIIDSLGLPPILKPLAKGFVDNLLKDPEKLKQLAASIGVKLPDGSNKTETGLL